MNDNLNLVEILKDCPEGTKLYSPALGEVEFVKIVDEDGYYPIRVIGENGNASFTSQGKLFNIQQGECLLFPSREQRNWDLFTVPDCKKGKFDPKTLRPFDRVLVRDTDSEDWACGLFSHKFKNLAFPYRCMDLSFVFCIPYNDDTKHLIGTNKEAPEYYRYWEE